MANYCTKCGTQTILMSGKVTLEPYSEPYERGKKESPRTDIGIVEKYIYAQYCENCENAVETFTG
jgi:hypothetical protein